MFDQIGEVREGFVRAFGFLGLGAAEAVFVHDAIVVSRESGQGKNQLLFDPVHQIKPIRPDDNLEVAILVQRNRVGLGFASSE